MKRKEADKLIDHLTSSVTAWCEGKGLVRHSTELIGLDEVEGADIFYSEGWRVIRGKLLCPECVKRKEGT